MKTMVRATVGIAAIGILLSLGAGAVQAQTGTKVAVLNMFVVSKGYNRIKAFKKEMQAMAKPYEEKIKKCRDSYEGWKKALEATTDKTKKEEYSKNALLWKRAFEDAVSERNKKLMGRADQHVVMFYREIESATHRYAKANGIQLVFYYFEPAEKKHSVQNIQRKLSSATFTQRAANPLYVAPGVDISNEVLRILNAQYSSTGGAKSAGGP